MQCSWQAKCHGFRTGKPPSTSRQFVASVAERPNTTQHQEMDRLRPRQPADPGKVVKIDAANTGNEEGRQCRKPPWLSKRSFALA